MHSVLTLSDEKNGKFACYQADFYAIFTNCDFGYFCYNFVQRFKKVGVIEPCRCGINNLSVISPTSSSVSQPLSINPYVNDWSRARYPEYQAFLRNT